MEKRIKRLLLVLLSGCVCGGCRWIEPSFSVLYGNYCFHKGEYQQAIFYYRRALESHQYQDWIQYNLSNAYYEIGEIQEAIKALEPIQTLSNRELKLRQNFNQGNLYFQIGKYKEAYYCFKKTLELDSSSLDAKINLEHCLVRLESNGTRIEEKPLQDQNETVNDPSTAEYDRLLDYMSRREVNTWSTRQNNDSPVQPNDW